MELLPRKSWETQKPSDKGHHMCPFCVKNPLLIWEGKYWNILHNKFPILGLKNHLILIPIRHVLYTSELSHNELLEMGIAEQWLRDHYAEINYFSFIRQSLNSRSLEHLHYHYLPGNVSYDSIEHMLILQGFPNEFPGKQ